MGQKEQEQIPPKQEHWTVRDIAEAIGNPNIASVRARIGNLRKRDPKIEPNRIPDGTGRIVNAYQKNVAQYLIQRLWPKNRKRETPKPQEFLTLGDGDKFPLLRGEKQKGASKLLTEARNKRQPLSKQKLRETLYPDDAPKEADRKVRQLIFDMKKGLKPHGWTIENPMYIDRNGRKRRIRGFYEVLKENKPLLRKTLQVIKPEGAENKTTILPTSATIWNPPMPEEMSDDPTKTQPTNPKDPLKLKATQKEVEQTIWESPQTRKETLKKEELKQLKEQVDIDLALAVVSHIVAGEHAVKMLEKNAEKLLSPLVPKKMLRLLDSVIGVKLEKDKKIREKQINEFCVDRIVQTIQRLWDKPINLYTNQKERDLIAKFVELKRIQDINTTLAVVYKHFKVSIPENTIESMIA